LALCAESDAEHRGDLGDPPRERPVVVGAGTDWREAVDGITWESGDMLLLGSGAAGPMAQVFLGSAASKIIRHAPVPVMIVPRQQTSA